MNETAKPEKKKLIIGVPAFAGIVAEAQNAFMGMIFRCGRDLPWLDVAVEIVTRKEQWRAKNNIVDAAIGIGAEWLLFLDDDVLPSADLVSRLLAHKKDVVGGYYHQRGGSYHPVLMRRARHDDQITMSASFVRHSDPILTNPGLHKIDILGGGCQLFRVDVFRKLMPPYFFWERDMGTDLQICTRLQDAGVEIYVDTSLELGHVRDERQIVTSRTVPLADREMAHISEQLWNDAVAYSMMAPEELESAMVQAGQRVNRQAKWHEHDRSTWPGVRAYYQSFGDWHVHNLLLYNLNHREPTKEWAILRSEGMLGRGAHVIDFGCGLGHVSLPLVERYGHRVHAYDIAGAATLPFLRYRLRKHGMGLHEGRHRGVMVYEMEEPVPHAGITPAQPVDGAFAISMIEHTWDPWGCLRWLWQAVKPGGFLVCDYAVEKMEEKEPQHLRRYDPATFANDMAQIGWHESPEYRWLFLKRPTFDALP